MLWMTYLGGWWCLGQSDVLSTSCELNVFVAALAWLEHDYKQRRSMEEQVMDCIRFPLIDDQTLMLCFKPPLCPDAVVNAQVKLKLVKAVLWVDLLITRAGRLLQSVTGMVAGLIGKFVRIGGIAD